MRRREFIAVLGGAAAWPLAARTQQAQPKRRIGVLFGGAENDPETKRRSGALVHGLRQLGWTGERNLEITYRFTDDPTRMRAYAAEIVALKPDAIVVHSNPFVANLRAVNRAIPTVFVQVADPVGSGFVDNMARPGGVVTGFLNFEADIGSKWLGILKEVVPTVETVTVLMHEPTAAHQQFFQAAAAAGSALGVTVKKLNVRDAAEIEQAVIAAARETRGGLLVLPHPITLRNRELIGQLALQHRLPNVAALDVFARSGSLIAYGVDAADLFSRAAAYVDRILKGEKPGDLPVQAPTKYELIINLKTARALGIEVPPTVLTRADEVIE